MSAGRLISMMHHYKDIRPPERLRMASPGGIEPQASEPARRRRNTAGSALRWRAVRAHPAVLLPATRRGDRLSDADRYNRPLSPQPPDQIDVLHDRQIGITPAALQTLRAARTAPGRRTADRSSAHAQRARPFRSGARPATANRARTGSSRGSHRGSRSAAVDLRRVQPRASAACPREERGASRRARRRRRRSSAARGRAARSTQMSRHGAHAAERSDASLVGGGDDRPRRRRNPSRRASAPAPPRRDTRG